MAFSNMGRNKKRTVLVFASLSLAVILLNSVFTVTHSFDLDVYLSRFASSDFLIANAGYFQYMYRGGSEETIQEEKLSESMIQVCEELDGFQEGGRLYGDPIGVRLKIDSWSPPDYVPRDENGEAGRYINGRFPQMIIILYMRIRSCTSRAIRSF